MDLMGKHQVVDFTNKDLLVMIIVKDRVPGVTVKDTLPGVTSKDTLPGVTDKAPMPPYVVLKSKGRKEECKGSKRTMNTSDRQELTKEDISDVSLEVIQRGIKEGLMTHYLPCFF
ncbi:PREDICTED: uncharacterized protein LOC101300505 [Fragaria vesca subsp. vesca]